MRASGDPNPDTLSGTYVWNADMMIKVRTLVVKGCRAHSRQQTDIERDADIDADIENVTTTGVTASMSSMSNVYRVNIHKTSLTERVNGSRLTQTPLPTESVHSRTMRTLRTLTPKPLNYLTIECPRGH